MNAIIASNLNRGYVFDNKWRSAFRTYYRDNINSLNFSVGRDIFRLE